MHAGSSIHELSGSKRRPERLLRTVLRLGLLARVESSTFHLEQQSLRRNPENLGNRERLLLCIILIDNAAGNRHGLQESTCGEGGVRAAAYFNLSHFMRGFFPSILDLSNLSRKSADENSWPCRSHRSPALREAIGDSDARLRLRGQAPRLLWNGLTYLRFFCLPAWLERGRYGSC